MKLDEGLLLEAGGLVSVAGFGSLDSDSEMDLLVGSPDWASMAAMSSSDPVIVVDDACQLSEYNFNDT